MTNFEAEKLKIGDLIKPKKNRITSDGTSLDIMHHMIVSSYSHGNWETHIRIRGTFCAEDGSSVYTGSVFCDAMELFIADKDAYDIFTCK